MTMSCCLAQHQLFAVNVDSEGSLVSDCLQAFRKAIGVKINEDTEVLEGEVSLPCLRNRSYEKPAKAKLARLFNSQ